MNLPIYLDNHSTTRTDPRVLEEMLPYFSDLYGNAASRTHAFGWSAEAAVERAREQVAGAIGARPDEIIFTSGATESINLAIKGIMEAGTKRHLITAVTEHRAGLDACRTLERRGYSVTYLPVDAEGFIRTDHLERAITEQTALVSIMYGNNEIGTLQPLDEIGALCRNRGIPLHTDATQALGKVPFNVEHSSLASFSAHKLYGPKGCGALYVSSRSPGKPPKAQIDGGGHERGMRSGTLNVPGIVGFGRAAELATADPEQERTFYRSLRDRLWNGLLNGVNGLRINGPNPLSTPDLRLPNNLNIAVEGIPSDLLLMELRSNIALSSGSACSSAQPKPSHVLQALGADNDRTASSVRLGVGRFNTEEEIDRAIVLICDAIVQLRKQRHVNIR